MGAFATVLMVGSNLLLTIVSAMTIHNFSNSWFWAVIGSLVITGSASANPIFALLGYPAVEYIFGNNGFTHYSGIMVGITLSQMAFGIYSVWRSSRRQNVDVEPVSPPYIPPDNISQPAGNSIHTEVTSTSDRTSSENSEPYFDEEFYCQVKPQLQKAWEAAKVAYGDTDEALRDFVRKMTTELGVKRDPFRIYIKQFYIDIQNVNSNTCGKSGNYKISGAVKPTEQVVDVTETACEAGFDCKVYLTPNVWEKCCEWTDVDNKRQDYQDWDARLWDVLFVPAQKIKMGNFNPVTGMTYQIYCLIRDGVSKDATQINLKVLPVDGGGLIIDFT